MNSVPNELTNSQELFGQISKISHSKISISELITLLDIHYSELFTKNPWMKKEVRKLASEFVENDPNHLLSKQDACHLIEAFVNVSITSPTLLTSVDPVLYQQLEASSTNDISTVFEDESSSLPIILHPKFSSMQVRTVTSPKDAFVSAFEENKFHFAATESFFEMAFSKIDSCLTSVQSTKKDSIKSRLVERYIQNEESVKRPDKSPFDTMTEATLQSSSDKSENFTKTLLSNVLSTILSVQVIFATVIALIAISVFCFLHTSSKTTSSKTRPS
ncbi:hypothetical protein POMI540_4638 [Schizosaccharomyces pombe]